MDFSKFRPLRKKILVRRDAKKSVDGGIIIPESWQQYGWRATVVAVGNEVKNCKPGDTILFLKEYTVLPFPEREMAITESEHIMARIEADAANVERIRPQNKFALVMERKPKMSGSDIVVIPNKQENEKSGLVMAVGPECEYLKPYCQIVYSKRVAGAVEEDAPMDVVEESDVLCMKN